MSAYLLPLRDLPTATTFLVLDHRQLLENYYKDQMRHDEVQTNAGGSGRERRDCIKRYFDDTMNRIWSG